MGATVLAVECRGLRKVYGAGRGLRRQARSDVVAVDGIDLAIEKGECFGLLGPNGAGKTTTVEILEGLNEPTAGQVSLLGLTWERDAENIRGRIGVCLQETQLEDRLSVVETLELFRSFFPSPRTVGQLLGDVQLEEKRDAWVGKLSGGQKQRLAIACALIGDPEILFLDEPTTGLDPQSRRQLWELIDGYRKRGGTVLITTHYMEEAERLCDRVAIVDHGKVIRSGTPRELIASLGGEHVIEFEASGSAGLDEASLAKVSSVTRVRREPEAWLLAVSEPHRALPALFAHLEASGASLEHLATRHGTLEDVFVTLTGRHLRDG